MTTDATIAPPLPLTCANQPAEASKGRVLFVDDDAQLASVCANALMGRGHEVATAANGLLGLALLESAAPGFDVILTDISMPSMDGVSFLRAVRARDPHVPVVLITGNPRLETAVAAIELGALRYLTKPFPLADLYEITERAIRLHRLELLKREALAVFDPSQPQLAPRASLDAALSRAVRSLRMAYQPIVRLSERRIFAFEALVRTVEPELPNPGVLLGAAEQLGRLDEVGRAIRAAVAATVAARGARDELVFVNLHSQDLKDESLFSPDSPLSAFAEMVVLEVTERASLDGIGDIGGRIRRLRDIGYRIAVDDLGAGYAGLTTFAQLEPDVVKFDISLVRDVDREPLKQRLVRAMNGLCRELGILAIAEGVERAEERDALLALGCDLHQGYLFARPGPPFPTVDL